MKIRHAEMRDFERMLEIYACARQFMADHGNPLQWGPTCWPPADLVHSDIVTGRSYVCEEDDRVIGVFYYEAGRDIEPTYAKIEEGQWADDSPYGVVHRIATDGSVKGAGAFCIDWAFRQCGHLRIDTHGDNTVMQNLLTKLGFQRRGTIYVVEDPYPRFAYEKSTK